MPKPPDIRAGRQASPRTNWRRRRARTTGDAPYLSARPSRLSTSYRRAANANTTPQKNASPRAVYGKSASRPIRLKHKRLSPRSSENLPPCRGLLAAIPKHTEWRGFAGDRRIKKPERGGDPDGDAALLFSDRHGREAGDGGRGRLRHVVEIENGGTFDRDRARSGRQATSRRERRPRHESRIAQDTARTAHGAFRCARTDERTPDARTRHA